MEKIDPLNITIGPPKTITMLEQKHQTTARRSPQSQPPLHTFYLKSVKETLPHHLNHIEYNIGLQLKNRFQLPKLNNTPHASHPSPFYKQFIKIIEQHNMTQEEILRGKMKEIYARIKTTKPSTLSQLEMCLG